MILCFVNFSSRAQNINLQQLDNFYDSLDYFRAIAEKSKDHLFLGQYHFAEATISEFTANTDTTAIYHFRNSIKHFTALRDEKMLNRIKFNIAEVYLKNDLFEEAEILLKENLAFQLNEKDTAIAAHGYSALANLYYATNSAEQEFLALEEAENLARDSFLTGIVYFQKARFYLGHDNFNSSLEYCKKAIPYVEMNNWRNHSGILLITAENYQKLGQSKKAILFAEKAIEHANLNTQKKQLSNALCFISQVYSEENAFEQAFEYSQACNLLKDSLNKVEKDLQVNHLIVKIDQEKARNQLLRSKEETTIKELKLASRNRWLALLAVCCSLLLVLLFYLRKNYLKRIESTLSLQQKQDELHKEMLKRAEIERRHAQGLALLKGQEDERRRISQDLHDGIGGVLSSVRMNLDAMANTESIHGNSHLRHSLEGIKQAIQEVRAISLNSMPKTLQAHGLIVSLQDFISSMQHSTEITIKLHTYGEINLDVEKEIMVFRILQELINNSVKHSRAKMIEVLILREKLNYRITVSDNGIGFNKEKIERRNGLNNIRNRVKFLNGDLEIDSKEGAGSTFFIIFPG